jgi:hypothetical protein
MASVGDGQGPHPDPCVFEDRDAAPVEVRGKVAEICQHYPYLMFGVVSCREPEQDNGRLRGFSQSEDRAKIGVAGYQDAAFLSGTFENYLVVLRRYA